jgi:hypothetical protein
VIITFVMSVCLYFHPSARSSSSPTEQNFLNIGVLLLVCIYVANSDLVKISQNGQALQRKTYLYL